MKSLTYYINSAFKPRIATQILVCEFWGMSILSYSKAVLLRLPFMDFLVPIVVPMIMILTALVGTSYWIKKIRGFDLLFVIGFASLFIFSWGINSNNGMFEEYWIPFLFGALPIYFIGVLFEHSGIEKPLFYISLFTILLQGVNSLVLEQAEAGSMADNDMAELMYTSYKVLPHTLYLLLYLFKKFNIVALLGGLFGMLLMFSYGTRGPIVCAFVFVGLYILCSSNKKNRFWFILALLIAGYFLVNNLLSIALFMSDLTSQMGMSDRIFNFVINDDIAHYSGRDDILQTGLKALETAPLFGYGIGGSWMTMGGYSHNIALDILTSFGLLIGPIILLSLLVLFILTYRQLIKNNEELAFFLLLFSCGFVKFFMSSYVLGDPYFFLLLGYCVGRLRGITWVKHSAPFDMNRMVA